MKAKEARIKQIENHLELKNQLDDILDQINITIQIGKSNFIKINPLDRPSVIVLNHLANDLGFTSEIETEKPKFRGAKEVVNEIIISW